MFGQIWFQVSGFKAPFQSYSTPYPEQERKMLTPIPENDPKSTLIGSDIIVN